MRFGVNALRLSGQRLGIGRYIEYLLKHWSYMLSPADRVTLYIREAADTRGLHLPEAFETRVLHPAMQGVLWENLLLPRHSKETDVLFCPSYTVPLAYSGRCVVATHSVNEVKKGTHPWWYHLTYRQRYRLSAQKADAVIVPLECTKEHVQELYGIAPEKIDIVPEGADDSFHPLEDQAVLRETRQKYFGKDRPYIVFVGKLSQRRNIPALLTAFSRLKKSANIPHGLLLFGPNILGLPLDRMTAELGITDSVVQTDGRLNNHQDIIPIYCAADVFVHPSSYEGFSITLVEAMACGVPVVTVNQGAARDIAGGVAVMVDEPTADNLTEAIHRALTDRSLAMSLRAKAIERAKSFRYEETARRTLDILRRVAMN
jgi:glycosyltransferase involved in cell wall biosynthesis